MNSKWLWARESLYCFKDCFPHCVIEGSTNFKVCLPALVGLSNYCGFPRPRSANSMENELLMSGSHSNRIFWLKESYFFHVFRLFFISINFWPFSEVLFWITNLLTLINRILLFLISMVVFWGSLWTHYNKNYKPRVTDKCINATKHFLCSKGSFWGKHKHWLIYFSWK